MKYVLILALIVLLALLVDSILEYKRSDRLYKQGVDLEKRMRDLDG